MNNAAIQSYYLLPTATTNWHIVESADILGDGNNDLVWQDSNTRAVGVWYFKYGLPYSYQYLTYNSIYKLVAVGPAILATTVSFEPPKHRVKLIWLLPGTNTLYYQEIVNGVLGTFNNGFWTTPIAGPNAPIVNGCLQPGWSVDGTGAFAQVFGGVQFFGTSTIQYPGGMVLEKTDGTIAFVSLEDDKGVISTTLLPYGWHIAGTGDFFKAGRSDLVLQNLATGQRGIWIIDQYGRFVNGIWLPTEPTDWRIANH
jgi:hypothetical protein